MQRSYKIPVNILSNWRKLFMEQMQDLELHELVQWIKWQRQCHYAEMAFDIKQFYLEQKSNRSK